MRVEGVATNKAVMAFGIPLKQMYKMMGLKRTLHAQGNVELNHCFAFEYTVGFDLHSPVISVDGKLTLDMKRFKF